VCESIRQCIQFVDCPLTPFDIAGTYVMAFIVSVAMQGKRKAWYVLMVHFSGVGIQ